MKDMDKNAQNIKEQETTNQVVENENSSANTDEKAQEQNFPPVELLYEIKKQSEELEKAHDKDLNEKFKELVQKSEKAIKEFMDKVEHNEKLHAQIEKIKNIKVHDIVEDTKKEVSHFKNVLEETIEKMELHDKLNEAKEKVNELNDKFLRLYSEFDNYRKRTQKEKADLHKNAGEDVIKSLLPVLDDFERAMKAMDENNDPEHVKEGVKLIYNKLLNTLKQKGLEPMEDATGKEFNVEEHEAITRVAAPSEDMKGKVIDQVERGYKLNGKVIRYAKVVVGQ
jgi:molecular chaperone GrpE